MILVIVFEFAVLAMVPLACICQESLFIAVRVVPGRGLVETVTRLV